VARQAVGCLPCWAAIDWLTGLARCQQPNDFFFAALAVVISVVPIVNTARFISQKAVNESFGTLGLDEGYESSNSQIVPRAVHVLTTRELGTIPTAQQTSFEATVTLIAHFASGAQAGRILAAITFRSQMTPTAHQTAIGDTVHKSLSVHWMCLLITPGQALA